MLPGTQQLMLAFMLSWLDCCNCNSLYSHLLWSTFQLLQGVTNALAIVIIYCWCGTAWNSSEAATLATSQAENLIQPLSALSGELSLLPSAGWEMNTGQSAVKLCRWEVKA